MSDQTTRVVHVRDNVPGAIYIGRAMPRQRLNASKWANPYKIGQPSYRAGGLSTRDMMTRQTAIGLYETHMRETLIADLPELRGRPLACWCRHDGETVTDANRCHGDILVWWLDTFTDDELREMAVQS